MSICLGYKVHTLFPYLTDGYLIRCQSHVGNPDYGKSDIDPSNLKVCFMPNWMNLSQIPMTAKSKLQTKKMRVSQQRRI